jgi:uncharacterized protein (TIGR00730 family)
MFKRICVFCGSNTGTRPVYTEAAETLGKLLAGRQIALVYGGGKVGLMGKLANAVLTAGGEVTGVIPQSLMRKEIAHAGLTDLRVVDSMHQRKALMADLSDAFIALPGGFGTFEEFCEIVTWAQLGLHRKPCGVLNVSGYYDHLLGLFDHAVNQRFLNPLNRSLVIAAHDPQELLDRLAEFKVPPVEKWIASNET